LQNSGPKKSDSSHALDPDDIRSCIDDGATIAASIREYQMEVAKHDMTIGYLSDPVCFLPKMKLAGAKGAESSQYQNPGNCNVK
jgi:hypothetical protein